MNPMHRFSGTLIPLGLYVAGLTAGGCASSSTGAAPTRPPAAEQTAAPSPKPAAGQVANGTADAPVARVGAVNISRQQLIEPLIESHGLQLLLNLVQLEMVKQEARIAKVTVSPGDIEAEQQRTLDRMFRDQKTEQSDYPMLLAQFLERRNMSRADWNRLMEINATLRKICEPKARGAITEDQLSGAFMQMYGEKVHVRHIELANLQEIAEAKRRMAGGESFEQVARSMSRNALTAPLGGEVRPFTMQAQYPPAFKDAAFALKNKDDISNPVQADRGYHLLQLIARIAPKVIKFEDVKASIREDLEENLVQQLTQELRAQLSDRASTALVILDPTLKSQYKAEQQRRDEQIRGREEVRREFERQRERAATQQAIPDLPSAPVDQPATQPK